MHVRLSQGSWNKPVFTERLEKYAIFYYIYILTSIKRSTVYVP